MSTSHREEGYRRAHSGAGHGGLDGGAKGNNNLEKDYTLKISKYMYDRFKELGVPVSITRSSDVTLSPKERVNKITLLL